MLQYKLPKTNLNISGKDDVKKNEFIIKYIISDIVKKTDKSCYNDIYIRNKSLKISN
jgi:hypothetical protein